jgi:carotenoid cleavage dioxygenase
MDAARGLHGPSTAECTVEGLEVVGRLPEGLAGRFLRIGPEPRSGARIAAGHATGGAAMVHEVAIGAGAPSYRNRWISGDGVGAPNSGLVAHEGRLFALGAGARPVELDDALEPVLDGPGTTWGSGAHAHVDPVWDELIVVEAARTESRLSITTIDLRGRVRRAVEIPTERPLVVHDFAFTDQYVVVVATSAAEDGERILWDPTSPARIGLIPRDGEAPIARWFDAAPRFVWHMVNAYEQDGEVVIDHIAHRQPIVGSAGAVALPGATAPALCRTVVTPVTGEVRGEVLDDRAVEYPAIDPRRAGLRHRVAYAALASSHFDGHLGEFDGLVRYDFRNDTVVDHVFPAHTTVGAPVVARRAGGTGEDDAWVLAITTDVDAGESRLVVFDPRTFERGPIAEVVLPQMVPLGHHAIWMPRG